MSMAFEESYVADPTETYSPQRLVTPRNAFSAEVADRLLEGLATDDRFRHLFQTNPRAALRQVGHDTPEQNLGLHGTDPVMCLVLNNGLASKEAICAGRGRIKAALASTLAHSVFSLSAS